MNPKLKKIISIIGLVFMGLFLISMFLYFISPQLLGGMLWLFSTLCFGIALLGFGALYFTRSFPSQQARDEEFKKAEREYYKKLDEVEAAKKEAAKNESGTVESGEKNPEENEAVKAAEAAEKESENTNGKDGEN